MNFGDLLNTFNRSFEAFKAFLKGSDKNDDAKPGDGAGAPVLVRKRDVNVNRDEARRQQEWLLRQEGEKRLAQQKVDLEEQQRTTRDDGRRILTRAELLAYQAETKEFCEQHNRNRLSRGVVQNIDAKVRRDVPRREGPSLSR
jgi:hypothetical protein